jgi:hypothetical protein
VGHHELPYGSADDHGQRTELKRATPADSVSDGSTEQAPNKRTTQADAHHKAFGEGVPGEAEVGGDALERLVHDPAPNQPITRTRSTP